MEADAMRMNRQIEVRAVPARPAPEVEFVEHKGTGHPDTLTDGFCEAASRDLSHLYLRSCGAVLHHNLDKGLLIAGRSIPRFGGGEIVRPMRFIVCGRATPLPATSVAEFIRESARSWLERRLALPVDPGQVWVEVGEGAAALLTPGRPMSLEAAAGKNPVAHVGKIYNLLALLIARRLHADLDGVDEVRVQLLSAIGAPLDQPQVASVELVGHRIGSTTLAAATQLVDERLRNVREVTDLVLQERVALF